MTGCVGLWVVVALQVWCVRQRSTSGIEAADLVRAPAHKHTHARAHTHDSIRPYEHIKLGDAKPQQGQQQKNKNQPNLRPPWLAEGRRASPLRTCIVHLDRPRLDPRMQIRIQSERACLPRRAVSRADRTLL